MKKILKGSICFVMALLMGVITPAQCLAEDSSSGKYLSELKVGYGDTGKAYLANQGYRVYQQNVNEAGQGEAVWLGYKTTDNKNDAITDIATMNMNGRYSFDKYAEYIQTAKETAATAANKFFAAVEEYEAVFKDKQESEISEIAKLSLEFVNKFYDEDYTDPSGQVSNKIGDMIANGKMTKDELTKIFYQGNGDNLTSITRFIALGLTEGSDDNFLTRLKSFEYTDRLSTSRSTARSEILSDYEAIRQYMLVAKEYADLAAENGGKQRYLKSITDTTEQAIAADHIGVYETAAATQYGSNLTMPDGNRMTLYDALTLPTESEYNQQKAAGEEPECKYTMDAYMIDILAQAMTSGALGCYGEVSLPVFIVYAGYANETDIRKAMSALISTMSECVDVSVYAGVDRSLLTDTGDVAMTAATIDEMNKGLTNNIGRKDAGFWETNKALKISMITIGSIAAVAAITLTIICFVRRAMTRLTYTLLPNNAVFVTSYGKYRAASIPFINTTYSCFIAGAIAWAIFVACLIVFLVKALEKPKEQTKIEYTKIPRALVHMIEKNEEKLYYNYYAVKLVNASEDKNDYMNVYGDINGRSGACQWEVLYYTKDTRCGSPLSGDIEFVLDNPSTDYNESKGYLPIHDFDQGEVKAATNLNAHSAAESPRAIYAYAKRAVEQTSTGSIFDESPLATSLISLIVGAGLSCAITLFITKKKRVA